MPEPSIVPMLRGGRFRVVCEEHDLDRTVDTQAHAVNLLALHTRVDHPEASGPDELVAVAVSDAAALLVAMAADPTLGCELRGAAQLYGLLVGLTDRSSTASVEHARALLASPRRVVAYTVPF